VRCFCHQLNDLLLLISLFDFFQQPIEVKPKAEEIESIEAAETKVPLMQKRLSLAIEEEPPFGVHLEKISTDRGTI
jgi:hypothetical protein